MTTSSYLPKWATAQEAGEWLQTTTGEAWPLPRLIEAGAEMAVHLDCANDAPPEIVEVLFMGRREGFMAPVHFMGDIDRMAFVRDGGTLTMTQRPDGATVRITPPARFAAEELRFQAASLRAIAAAVQTGAQFDEAPRVVGNLSIAAESESLAAWLDLHDGAAGLDGARIDVLSFEDDLHETAPSAAEPAPAAEGRAAAGNQWQELAQVQARQIIKRQAERDLYPSQKHVADEVAADFRKRGIVGADGKPLTGSTIKRHALKGITSATKRTQSTALHRGK